MADFNIGTATAYIDLDMTSFTTGMRTVGQDLKTFQNDSLATETRLSALGHAFQAAGTGLTNNLTKPLLDLGATSLTAAIEYESAFAGVRKTVEATESEFENLSTGIRDMAKDVPMAATELAGLAESAGQLGISTENILGFTRTIADLGVATNIVGQEGAAQIARFANVVGMSQTDFDRFGSSIVALGNNFATTEAEILAMSTRLAGAGSQIGMSEADILGLATALSSVGIEAEAGGSAFSKVMSEMQLAVETNSARVEDFAKVAGMSADEFSSAFRDNAAGALTAFVTGLNNTERNGKSAIAVLDEMEISEIRMRDALLRTAGAGDILTESIALSSKAWEENNALANEAEQRYATTESRIALLKNSANDLAIGIGEALLPLLEKLIEALMNVVDWLNSLSDGTKTAIIVIGGIVAAIGPMLLIIANVITAISTIMSIVPLISTGLLALKGVIIGLSATLHISLPILGLIAAAIVAIVTAITLLVKNLNEETEAQKASKKAADEKAKATAALNDEIERTAEAHEKSINEINAENQANKDLTDKVYALMEAENKSTAQKAELQNYVKMLNEQVDGLNLSYNEENDLLTESKENIYALIDAKTQQLKVQAEEERYVELLKQKADIERQLRENGEQLLETVREYGFGSKEAQKATEKLNEEDNELANNLKNVENELSIVTGSLEANAEAAKTVTNANQELLDEQERIAQRRVEEEERVKNAVLESANAQEITYEELQEQLKASADAILGVYEDMTSGLSDLTKQIELDNELLWENVRKNQEESIKNTEKFSNLYAELINAGISESYLAAIGANRVEAIPLLESMMDEGVDKIKASEKEWQDAYKGVSDTLIDALEIDEEQRSAIESYISGETGIYGNLKSSISGTDFNLLGYGIGNDITKGMERGILAGTPSINSASDQIAWSSVQAAKNTLGIQSPSKVFEEEIAKMQMLGWENGIKKYGSDVVKATEQTAEDTYNYAKLWIENYRNDTNYLAEEEIKMWEHLKEKYTDISKEKIEIDNNIRKIREQNLRETEKIHNDLLKEQEEIINKITEAQEKYNEALEDRTEQIVNMTNLSGVINETDTDRLDTLMSETENVETLTQKLREMEAQRREGNMTASERIQLEREYIKTQKELAEATDKMAKAEKRAKKSQPELILDEMRNQIKGLKEWETAQDSLINRNIDKNALAELSKEEIIALSKMTDEQLTEYEKLWKEKNETARKIAADDLKGMKEDTVKEVTQLTEQLDGINRAIAENGFNTGADTLKNMLNGFKSEENNVFNWLKEFGGKVSSIISEAMGGLNDFAVNVIEPAKPHLQGLDNVPYDGYVAMLHKGERVLTAEENKSSEWGQSGGNTFIQNIYGDTADRYEMYRDAENLLRMGGTI